MELKFTLVIDSLQLLLIQYKANGILPKEEMLVVLSKYKHFLISIFISVASKYGQLLDQDKNNQPQPRSLLRNLNLNQSLQKLNLKENLKEQMNNIHHQNLRDQKKKGVKCYHSHKIKSP